LEDIVIKPIEVGIDVLIFSGWRLSAKDGVKALLFAVKDGKIEEEKIDQAIERIIEIKKKLR